VASNLVCEAREGFGSLGHGITICLKVVRHILPLIIGDCGALMIRSAHELANLVDEDLARSGLDIEGA
jgi:hypothetical protein